MATSVGAGRRTTPSHRHHHVARRSTEALNRSCQAPRRADSRDHSTPGYPPDAGAASSDPCAVAGGRRGTLDGQRDHLLATQEDEPEAPLLKLVALGKRRGVGVSLGLLDGAELLAVTEHKVHVFVKGHEGPDQRPAVLDGDPHAVVDVVQHLALLGKRHLDG